MDMRFLLESASVPPLFRIEREEDAASLAGALFVGWIVSPEI